MKKLLIIGNGFDLHLYLKSSFRDFFKSKHSDISNQELYRSISDANSENYKLSGQTSINISDIIKLYTESSWIGSGTKELKTHNKLNFWILYFGSLSNFPDYNNLDDEFEDSINSNYVYNWSDVEYQMQLLLSISEEAISTYQKITTATKKYNENYSYGPTTKNLIKSYENCFLNSNEKMTYKGVLILNLFTFALISGWGLYTTDLYDYLFEELEEFEREFKEYLTSEINGTNYKSEAIELCSFLVDKSLHYNLINFNYTSFYKLDNHKKVNIHSTLGENGHPIIGISSDTGQEDDIFKKPYFKFSKTYRIMSLSSSKDVKEILPKNVNEIIFYGQSLSDADYLYFENIFNHYKIYDKDSNIKLIFKYSNFEDKNSKITPEQSQVLSAYQLINKFAERNGHKNLLTNQLMYRRICIDLLKEK